MQGVNNAAMYILKLELQHPFQDAEDERCSVKQTVIVGDGNDTFHLFPCAKTKKFAKETTLLKGEFTAARDFFFDTATGLTTNHFVKEYGSNPFTVIAFPYENIGKWPEQIYEMFQRSLEEHRTIFAG